MQASCTLNMKVSTEILRSINFVYLANQTGVILHSRLIPTQAGSSSSTLVMTTSLNCLGLPDERNEQKVSCWTNGKKY